MMFHLVEYGLGLVIIGHEATVGGLEYIPAITVAMVRITIHMDTTVDIREVHITDTITMDEVDMDTTVEAGEDLADTEDDEQDHPQYGHTREPSVLGECQEDRSRS